MYAAILGAGWDALPAVVRAIHQPGEVRGQVRVRRAANPIARVVAWLLRFPPPGDHVSVQLRIERDGDGQRWQRQFGSVAVNSLQRPCGGRIRESYGPVCLDFDLAASAEMLVLTQRAAALRFGSLLLPLPAWLAPRTTARVSARGSQAHLEVEIRVPLCGLVLGYDGLIAATRSTA